MLDVKSSEPPPPASSAGLSTGEAPRRTGVSVHTSRYHERSGLVASPAGGRRRFHQLDLDRITVCTGLRATGMPIKTIRRCAELVADGRGNEQERLALLSAHRNDLAARITESQHRLELVDHKIDVYSGGRAAGAAHQLWAPTRVNSIS